MTPLDHPPRTFREFVEADLRRAARLIIKVQDEIDPQIRVATPTGDWAIAVTLTTIDQVEALRALQTFMVWKQATAFTLATELRVGDAIWCCGISRDERLACFARIARSARPWTAANFGPVEWMPESSIDPRVIATLPLGPRALKPSEVSEMAKWFGKSGRFPAVNLATGEVGA